jgi:hypothetical protein
MRPPWYALDAGGEATARSYADEEFKDASFVTYQCIDLTTGDNGGQGRRCL